MNEEAKEIATNRIEFIIGAHAKLHYIYTYVANKNTLMIPYNERMHFKNKKKSLQNWYM